MNPRAFRPQRRTLLVSLLAGAELAGAAAPLGVLPSHLGPAALGRELQRESAEWARIVRERRIAAE